MNKLYKKLKKDTMLDCKRREIQIKDAKERLSANKKVLKELKALGI